MASKLVVAIAASAGIGVGAVLAPLTAQAGHTNELLEADLDGRSEVAAAGSQKIAGDPNGRGSAYVFGIDGDATTLCYIIEVDKIAELDQAPGGPRAAHIHPGAAGTNGPVAVTLAWPQGGQAADCLTEGEAGKGLEPGEVQRILADPSSFYVNVHNGEYPGGAVRGQLSAR